MPDEIDRPEDPPVEPFFQYRVIPLDEPELAGSEIPSPPPFPSSAPSPPEINLDSLYGWNQTNLPGEVADPELIPLAKVEEIQESPAGQRRADKDQKKPLLVLPAPMAARLPASGLMDLFNNGFRTLFLGLFWAISRLLILAWSLVGHLLAALSNPVQTAEGILLFIEPMLQPATAVIVGLSLLAGSGGLLFWFLDSLTWVHVSRWLPAVASVPLAAWLCFRFASWSARAKWFCLTGSGIAAFACWWFLPTLQGHNLWSAQAKTNKIQRQLTELTPGLFARFQEGRPDRLALVQEYPQFLPVIRQLEDAWIERSVKEDSDSMEKRKLTPEGVQERFRRLAQNLQVLAERPLETNQITPFRRDLFRLRLDKARETATNLVKKDRIRDAYDQVVQPVMTDLDAEARELGWRKS